MSFSQDDPASSARPDAPGSGAPLALLLPLDSRDFAAPANAVQLGCRAALAAETGAPALQVLRTDASPQAAVAQHAAARECGARVIVGPLTRDAVDALARQSAPRGLSVPTLALNAPLNAGEPGATLPANLMVFGLSLDAEAQQVARQLHAEGVRDAVVVQAGDALSRRIAQAFAQSWFAMGAKLSDAFDLGPAGSADMQRMKARLAQSRAQVVFLAAGPAQAATARPYLNNQIPTWGTSLLVAQRDDPVAAVDLNGIRLLDMPWMLSLDHPAVMAYPREPLPPAMQRFYALGIDACRVAIELLRGRRIADLDGVTGRLQLRDGTVTREPMDAVIRDGSAVQFDATAASMPLPGMTAPRP